MDRPFSPPELTPCPVAKGGPLDDDLRRSMSAAEHTLILRSKYRPLFRDKPIDGYVKFVGAFAGDRFVVSQVAEARPAAVNVTAAKLIASRTNLNLGSTGSRVSRQAEVYVVFYNQDKPDKLAMLFAIPAASVAGLPAAPLYYLEVIEYHVDPKTTDSKKSAPTNSTKSVHPSS